MGVCKSNGGLGIRSIEKMNKAMLGKWLWRLGNSFQGLWRQIIIDKYQVSREGWCVSKLAYKASGIWKSVLSFKGDFDRWIRYRIHDGKRIRSWHDEW